MLYRNLEVLLGERYLRITDELLAIGGRLRARGPVQIAQYVVHHTAGSPQQSPQDIWRYHVQRAPWKDSRGEWRWGWDTGGYHAFIDTHGTLYWCIPIDCISFGAGPRWNPTSVHIACIGNYRDYAPSAAMLATLYRVLCALDDDYAYKPWMGHCQLKSTSCPGEQLLAHLELMRGRQYGSAMEVGRQRPPLYP